MFAGRESKGRVNGPCNVLGPQDPSLIAISTFTWAKLLAQNDICVGQTTDTAESTFEQVPITESPSPNGTQSG